jgi:hypothetical protein
MDVRIIATDGKRWERCENAADIAYARASGAGPSLDTAGRLLG